MARTELAVLLEAHLLEKAVHEVGFELAQRPDWLPLPLRGILELLEPRPAPSPPAAQG